MVWVRNTQRVVSHGYTDACPMDRSSRGISQKMVEDPPPPHHVGRIYSHVAEGLIELSVKEH